MGHDVEVMTREEAKEFADRHEAMLHETMLQLSEGVAGIVPEEKVDASRKMVEPQKRHLIASTRMGSSTR